MNAKDLNRRVAAWLLTVPEPINAGDARRALEAACAKFDCSVPLSRFEVALRDLGYEFSMRKGTFYELWPAN